VVLTGKGAGKDVFSPRFSSEASSYRRTPSAACSTATCEEMSPRMLKSEHLRRLGARVGSGCPPSWPPLVKSPVGGAPRCFLGSFSFLPAVHTACLAVSGHWALNGVGERARCGPWLCTCRLFSDHDELMVDSDDRPSHRLVDRLARVHGRPRRSVAAAAHAHTQHTHSTHTHACQCTRSAEHTRGVTDSAVRGTSGALCGTMGRSVHTKRGTHVLVVSRASQYIRCGVTRALCVIRV
jgi:hypothetical protein